MYKLIYLYFVQESAKNTNHYLLLFWCLSLIVQSLFLVTPRWISANLNRYSKTFLRFIIYQMIICFGRILFWCAVLYYRLKKLFYVDFDFVLLSWHKRTKRSRLNINFTHLYASVKSRKTRLDTLWTSSLQHVKLVFCYAHAHAFYLRLQLS